MHRIHIRPYGADLYFTTDRGAFLAERGRYTDKPIDLSEVGGIASDFGLVHIVGVFIASTPTVAHEVAHVALKVLEHAGVPVDAVNSEAFCYLLEDLLGECLQYLNERSE